MTDIYMTGILVALSNVELGYLWYIYVRGKEYIYTRWIKIAILLTWMIAVFSILLLGSQMNVPNERLLTPVIMGPLGSSFLGIGIGLPTPKKRYQ